MAAIVKSGNTELMVVHAGQNGVKIERGVGSFNSTDATGTLLSGLEYVLNAKFTVIGDPASDEIISIGGTENAGRINRVSGSFTIKRTGASKTSALKFFYELVGR